MSVFTEKERAYLTSQRLGHLATVNAQGELHVVPVGFTYNAVLDTIDIGGVRGTFGASRKFRDATQAERGAFVVDDVAPGRQIRGIEVRGRAEALPEGGDQVRPGGDPAFIRLWPARIVAWGIERDDYQPFSRRIT